MGTRSRRASGAIAVCTALLAAPALLIPVAHASGAAPAGYLWGWGSNYTAELGNGCGGFAVLRPERNETLTEVTLISAGPLAVTADGQLWAWGYNAQGEVGDGTTEKRCEPVMVPGMDDVTAISGGHLYSLAVRESGRVWAWGDNDRGQLGIGTMTDSLSPVRVPHLKKAVAVDAGPHHALALRANGTVKAWGSNFSGELGDGGESPYQLRPRKVPGLSDVVAISAGGYYLGAGPAYGFSLAVRADGTVWAWGDNYYGQLGDGTVVDRLVPTQIAGVDGVETASAGGYFSLALRDDGTAWAWGENNHGQLGDGSTLSKRTPQQVPGLADVTAVSAGHEYALSLRADGIACAWGDNNSGQIGIGDRDGDVLEPAQVVDLTGITSIAADSSTAYAIATPSSG